MLPLRADVQHAPSRVPLTPEQVYQMKGLPYPPAFSISPDGKLVAYIEQDPTRNHMPTSSEYNLVAPSGVSSVFYGSQVRVIDAATGQARFTAGASYLSWGLAWSPNGRLLGFYSDRGGSIHVEIWDRDRRRIASVSNVPVWQLGFDPPKWSPDGSKLLVGVVPSGMTSAEYVHAWLAETPKLSVFRFDPKASVVTYTTGLAASTTGAQSSGGVAIEHGKPVVPPVDLGIMDERTGVVFRILSNLVAPATAVSPDGLTIAYATDVGNVRATQQQVYDIGLLSLRDDTKQIIAKDQPLSFSPNMNWSPDGKSIAYVHSGMAAKGTVFVYWVETHRLSELTRAGGPHFSDSPAPTWSEDSRSLYVYAWSAPRYDRSLYHVFAADGRAQRIAEPAGMLYAGSVRQSDSERQPQPVSRWLYATVADNKTFKQGVARVDLTTSKAALLFREEGSITGYPKTPPDRAPSGADIVYSMESASRPIDLWLYDIATHKRRQLTHLNPAAERASLGEAILIDWKSRVDQKTLRGALLLPGHYVRGKRYPLIAEVYGGSFGSDNIDVFGFEGVTNAQCLASLGYAVLSPDSPLRAGTPMKDIAKTILPGIDRAIQMGIADPEKIGVIGHSYGGYTTMALIVQDQRFKAAVDQDGLVDLISGYGEKGGTAFGGVMGDAWAEKGQGGMEGSPWQYRQRYVDNSPLFFFDRIRTPVLIEHGTVDSAVPVDQAYEAYAALHRLGKTAELALYPREEHVPTLRPDIIDFNARAIDWFERFMPPPNGY
jgi:dipeptidyl aminopeptidase/acylaminoacyl peptidase